MFNVMKLILQTIALTKCWLHFKIQFASYSKHSPIKSKTKQNKNQTNKQKKATPLQAWTGPEGFRRLRLPDIKTNGT